MPFSATTSSSSFTVFVSRRILLHRPLHQSTFPSSPPPASATSHNSENGFDVNVIMVLSVLLCALVCSLGLNSIIRCALRCSSLVASQSGEQSSVRLANTGVKKKALKTFPTIVYAAGLKLPNLDTECVICLSEFVTGERVRILPKCNHGFHVRCIDRWLSSHSSCPTCRQCLLQTCQKIVGCSSSTSSEAPRTVVQETIVMCQLPQPQVSAAPPQETVVRIAALEPEGLLLSYGL